MSTISANRHLKSQLVNMRKWGENRFWPQIWEIDLYFEFGAHILQEFNMDDFQLIDGHFFQKSILDHPTTVSPSIAMTMHDYEDTQ